MADGSGNGGGNGGLYFIVGALCVAVAAGFLFFSGVLGGGPSNQAKTVDVKVELPKPEKK